MRTPPKLGIPASADAVTAEVRKLLRAAEIGRRLPTPRAQILACASLVETGELNLEEYRRTLSEKASDYFHRAMTKIVGILDRRTRVIYVDPQLHDSRKTFVTYHEVIHRIAPWQHIVCTEDDDLTLDPVCDELFEREANFGAAEILFQCERFEVQARDYDLSVASALHLATEYGASCHSSLRRFVERNHRPCLLLVVHRTSRQNADGSRSFFVSHAIPSLGFTLQFGEPFSQPFINPDEEIGRIINNGGGEMGIMDLKGFSRVCVVEPFNNLYKHFILVYPKDVAPSRTRVLLRAS